MNTTTTTIEQVVKEMQVQNYSPRTIQNYGLCLKRLLNYSDVPLEGVSINEFKKYLYHRITVDKISVSLINQNISAFKILQESVLGREWEPLKIKRPRRDKKLPVVLSQEELAKMIAVTVNIKHRAIIALAYSSGMRREEIRNLKPSEIDSTRMQVHVKSGKGNKDRYTLLAQKALELLRLYYKLEKPKTYLFEPVNKKAMRYGAETLNKIVKNSAKKAKIKKEISFHTLRHCFATHLLEKGVNLRLIQKFMGHSSIKTTAMYLHIANINPGSITSPLDDMDI